MRLAIGTSSGWSSLLRDPEAVYAGFWYALSLLVSHASAGALAILAAAQLAAPLADPA
jgi:hypothetical protein